MLILASKSPRRRELLAAAGIPFEVRLADVPEQRDPEEQPADYVRRLARQKAEAVPRAAGEIVLAADTIVVVEDEVLEKPADGRDAALMLAKLSGREHHVITGFCLVADTREIVDFVSTRVHFQSLSNSEIDAYVASGEPMDKAGAYAIQGLASKFIDRIEGDYSNVVGLPIARVYQHLRSLCPAS